MVKRLSACVIFAVLSMPSVAEEITIDHAKLTYEGIDAEQANSLAEVIAAARQVYVDKFGFKMPEVVVCSVKCNSDQPTRIYNDGKDHLFLLLASKDKLAKPLKSHTYVLYGLCHELGHLAMYRALAQPDWLTPAAVEGWAHYAGSVVVDCLYKNKGRSLWMDPYYYRRDGTARLRKQLKSRSPSEVIQAAGQWQQLETIIGRDGFVKLFSAWQTAQIDPAKPIESLWDKTIESFRGNQDKSKQQAAAAEKKPADANASNPQDSHNKESEPKSNVYIQIQVGDKIVHKSGRKTNEELVDWWSSAASLLIKKHVTGRFETVAVRPSQLTGEPITLQFDDDSSEGKKSLIDQDQAIKFVNPGIGDWYLCAVSVFGERFGPRQPPINKFEITLCDDQMKKIIAWKKPYALFEWGKLAWSRIEIPPTRVPKCFHLCLNFQSTEDQGIYVAFDKSTTGNSFVGKSDKLGAALEQGDWMIRVELDQLKQTDPLKAESLK